MAILILGMALWIGVHLFPTYAPRRRAALVAQVGEKPFKGAFALALVAAILLIVWGWGLAGDNPVDLWFPPLWLTHLNNLLMLLAFVVFGAGAAQSNVARVIRHPQLTGVKIWAVAHLLVNGDLRSVVLFGGMLGWAVAGVVLTNRRDGKPPLPGKQPLANDAKAVGGGLVLYLVVMASHRWLFGVSPFG